MKIIVNGSNYLKAVAASGHMGCSDRPSIKGTPEDPLLAEREGRLGEVAFGMVTGLDIDADYHQNGDQGDFIVTTHVINVKTTSMPHAVGLVRGTTWSGSRNIGLDSSIFVFAKIISEDRLKETALIDLVGWVTREEVLAYPLVEAWKGRHQNHEIPHLALKPMDQLVGYLYTERYW